jgi:DNA-directed RNA polymerase subunit A'
VFISRNYRPKEDLLFTCEEERSFAKRRLFPDEIQSIIRHVPSEALQIMGYKPEISHPLNYVFKAQLVPPPSIRPATSASSTEARMRGENDLTVALQDLVRSNNELSACIALGDNQKIEVAWDKLQIFAAAVINQNVKKLNTFNGTTVVHVRAMGKRKSKVIKDRLTGKKGRLRGNLSGKRVDQAGRSVVGPDSSHDIFQLGVPASIMRTLTFPEHVNARNVNELAQAVIRGAGVSQGALTVRHGTDLEEKVLYISLLDESGRKALAASLKPGWTVERHLRDGDWVLFNRQPSLHKASIMAFQAYEVAGLQFKLPLPCTKPFYKIFLMADQISSALTQFAMFLTEAKMATKTIIVRCCFSYKIAWKSCVL